MKDFFYQYSGICAIAGYSMLLWIVLAIAGHKKKESDPQPVRSAAIEASPLDESDENATVAALVAAIECRSECHKNVRVVSVREV